MAPDRRDPGHRVPAHGRPRALPGRGDRAVPLASSRPSSPAPAFGRDCRAGRPWTAGPHTQDRRGRGAAASAETRDPPRAAGLLFLGVDVGRASRLLAAVPESAFAGDRWQAAPVRRSGASPAGHAAPAVRVGGLGAAAADVRAGPGPTGGHRAQTIAAWLRGQGHRVDWPQDRAARDQRQMPAGKQAETDALDARPVARPLSLRERGLATRALLDTAPAPAAEALRLLVRNRRELVQLRSRHLPRLMALPDAALPELRLVFRNSSVGPTALLPVARHPTPAAVAAAPLDDLEHLIATGAHAPRPEPAVPRPHGLAARSVGLATGVDEPVSAQQWLVGQAGLADAEIARLDAEIARAMTAWPERDRLVLASFPALGPARQAVLLAAIGDARRFRDDRALRKRLGWHAELAQSGTSAGRHRLGAVGERNARRTVWLWALSPVAPQAGDTPFRARCRALRARGMRGSVAIGHLASKLVSLVYFCLLRGEPYDAARHWRELGLAPAEPDEQPDA